MNGRKYFSILIDNYGKCTVVPNTIWDTKDSHDYLHNNPLHHWAEDIHSILKLLNSTQQFITRHNRYKVRSHKGSSLADDPIPSIPQNIHWCPVQQPFDVYAGWMSLVHIFDNITSYVRVKYNHCSINLSCQVTLNLTDNSYYSIPVIL